MRIFVAGNVNVDLLMGRVAPWPQPGSEVVVDQYHLRVGGALGNAALALHALQVDVAYFANVGSDALGTWLKQELANSSCTLVSTVGATAVTVGLSHPDGERTFFTYEGHFEHFDIEPLQQVASACREGDLLLLCGYFLIPALRRHALSLSQEVAARGGRVLLDTGWPTEGWSPEVRAEVVRLLPHCAFFLPNKEELCSLTACDSVAEALGTISRLVEGDTIVKLGSEGAAYLAGTQVQYLSAPAVEVADTVGAGDTFNATFIHGLSRSQPWPLAAQLAVQAASLTVSSRPRRYPTADVLARLVALSLS